MHESKGCDAGARDVHVGTQAAPGRMERRRASPGTWHVLVVGGGYGGLIAAARAARTPRVRVTVVEPKDTFSQRIRLHQMLAGRATESITRPSLLADGDISYLAGTVEEIDTAGQHVRGRTPGGTAFHVGFDGLVLATGSRTVMRVPGVAENAVRLDDATAVSRASTRVARLAAGARVVVVGGGPTGVEAAAELAGRFPHLEITLLSSKPLRSLHHEREWRAMASRLQQLRVRVMEGVDVSAAEPGVLVHRDGLTRFDVCVWAAGFEAAPLAQQSGLPVLHDGRIRVDAFLRVPGFEHVFVAGDAAAAEGVDGAILRMACATAMPMGAHAGTNVARALHGRDPEPFRFGYAVRCMSLGRGAGLAQFTRTDGSPTRLLLDGRAGAAVRELVTRSTLWAVKLEVGRRLPLVAWRS